MQKSKPSKSQAEKLKELELSGLVDFTQQHARSVVDPCSHLTPAHCQLLLLKLYSPAQHAELAI